MVQYSTVQYILIITIIIIIIIVIIIIRVVGLRGGEGQQREAEEVVGILALPGVAVDALGPPEKNNENQVIVIVI